MSIVARHQLPNDAWCRAGCKPPRTNEEARRRRPSAASALTAAVCLFAAAAIAQPPPPPSPGCDPKTTLSIKTGVNESTNGLLPLNGPDVTWTVIADPLPGTTEPRPATVIQANPAWSTIPGTQWIGPDTTLGGAVNGVYKYKTCFCLKPAFGKATLNVSLLADDKAEVFLNDVSIGTTPPAKFVNPPATFTTSDPQLLVPGINCIRVDVTNSFGVATGLDLAATVTTANPGVVPPNCCEGGSTVTGLKWQDLNGDGVKQSGELPLANWVIQLSNGQSAVTDSNGNYYFFNVPPGTYTLSEVQQNGWQRIFPPGGTHSVTVVAGQSVVGKNFGNRPCPRCNDQTSIFIPVGPGSATACTRICCKKGETFFNNSCGCGCYAPKIGTEVEPVATPSFERSALAPVCENAAS